MLISKENGICDGKQQNLLESCQQFKKREFQETQNNFLRLPKTLSDMKIGGE